uniref:Uncharacterized protein n=1 Tax=Sphaerodactylus townsendi TaxID=933632 RepID=A0ACB8GC30_9SAUR
MSTVLVTFSCTSVPLIISSFMDTLSSATFQIMLEGLALFPSSRDNLGSFKTLVHFSQHVKCQTLPFYNAHTECLCYIKTDCLHVTTNTSVKQLYLLQIIFLITCLGFKDIVEPEVHA